MELILSEAEADVLRSTLAAEVGRARFLSQMVHTTPSEKEGYRVRMLVLHDIVGRLT